MPRVWLNGALCDAASARIDPGDRGFTLADGVFETIRVTAGRPAWLARHLARLREGLRVFGIALATTDRELGDALRDLIGDVPVPVADGSALRLTITRGAANERGLAVAQPAAPTALATLSLASPAAAADAISAVTTVVAGSTRRNAFSPLSRIKSLNYGDAIVARREATARGADDAIVLDTRQRVTGTSAGNIMVHVGGRWRTPPVDDGALPGLACESLRGLCEIDVVSLSPRDLERAAAAVMTTSLRAMPIAAIDGRPLTDASRELPLEALYAKP